MPRLFILASGLAIALIVQARAAPILKQEPPEGHLMLGQRVLVDDGTCPAGQIKEVSSGNNRVTGSTPPKSGMSRTRRCVKR